MTTNMIRKGLAVGSGVALASTLLVGAPANAAITQINLAPISGSGTGAILGGGFALAATSTGASSDELTFVVEGHDTATEILAGSSDAKDLLDSNGDSMTAGIAVTTNTADFADAELGTQAAYAALSSSNVADDDSIFFTEEHQTNAPYIVAGLGLDPAEVDETTTLTVYAFVDGNDNGIFESAVDGAKSNSISITYHAPDEVDYSVSQSLDIEGNEVEISVTPSNVNGASIFEDDNTAAISELFNTKVFVDGTEDSSNGDLTLGADDWDAADAAFVKTASSVTLTAGDIVTTKVYPGVETTGETTVRTDSGESDVDEYGDIKVSPTEPFADGARGGSTDQEFYLREGDGQVTLTMSVYDDGDETGAADTWDDVYLAGETVTWTIADDGGTSFDDKTEVTAGGNTLDTDTAGNKITATSVTNEDGVASLTISYSDLDDGQIFNVTAAVEGSNKGADAATVFEGEDPIFSSSNYDVVITNVDSTGSIVRDLNSSITLDLALRDDFGLAPAEAAKGLIRVSGGETTVERVVTFPANTGTTSVTFTDSSTDDNTLTVSLQSYANDRELDFPDASGDYDSTVQSNQSEDAEALLDGQSTITIVDGLSTVNSVDFVTSGSASHDSDTGTNLLDEQLSGFDVTIAGSFDIRSTGGVTDLDTNYAGGIDTALDGQADQLTAKVTDEDGLGIEGAAVTFAADGFLFADEEEEIFSAGSITVYTKSNGEALVYFGSNTSGDHEVTVTAGGDSDTIDVAINYAAVTNLDEVVVNSSATAEAGSTYTFSATMVDGLGNGLISAGKDGADNLVISYDGPGLTVGELPKETTSKGVIEFAILMGSNDSGTGTVTITYDDANIGTNHEYELEFELTVGEVASEDDVSYGTQKAWTVNQDDGTAKVYVKFPEIDGKLRILHQTGGGGSYDSIYSKTTTSETMDGLRIVEGVGTYVVRTIDLADGTNRIRVSVDGEDIEVNGKDRPARYNE